MIAYLRSIDQRWREDATNADTVFTRNRIRHELLPLLRSFNPAIEDALVRTATQANEVFTDIEITAAELLRLAEQPRAETTVILDRKTLATTRRTCSARPFTSSGSARRAGRGISGMTLAHWQREPRMSPRAAFPPATCPTASALSAMAADVVRVGPAASTASVYQSCQLETCNSKLETHMLRPIRRALFSVSDKTGLVDFARELHTKYGVELIATGGTKKALADAGLPVKDVSELTGFPEILDGRVKTLHPAIFAGLLAKRDKPEHMKTLAEQKLLEIDLVVCNLYPFEQTVAKPGVTEAEAIENIDIGGPCMLRAAAKNFQAVAVVTDPSEYPQLLSRLAGGNGSLDLATRRLVATWAFGRVADYDLAIVTYMDQPEGESAPEFFQKSSSIRMGCIGDLRYGENPHQVAAFYHEADSDLERPCIAMAEKLHGKELSYNNILDLDSGSESGSRVHRAGRGGREAQQPLRRSDRGSTQGRVPGRVGGRSAIGVWRHSRVQQDGRRRHG